jgi:CRP-like cAMP-binding protein
MADSLVSAPERRPVTMNAHLLRLHRSLRVDFEERSAFINLLSEPRRHRANRALVGTTNPVPDLYVIHSGVACRYLDLRDGRRQILSYLLPGDFYDVRRCFSPGDDSLVETLSTVEASSISARDVVRLAERFPQLMRELWRRVATEDATAQQWLVNVGRRSALERMAHLLCEIYVRWEATGLSTHDGCFFPISQVELADSLAISAVHVNRVLMELRKAGLVGLRERRLTIPDVPALRAIAGFNVEYLQIAGGRRDFTGLGAAELEAPVQANERRGDYSTPDQYPVR